MYIALIEAVVDQTTMTVWTTEKPLRQNVILRRVLYLKEAGQADCLSSWATM